MNHYMNEKIKTRMYTIMKAKGVTSSQVCRLLNMDYPNWVAVMDGRCPIYNKQQRKIAEMLGVDRDVLFREFVEVR